MRPPRVRTYSFLSHICHIYIYVFRVVIGLQLVVQSYPTYLPDVISVRQTKSLPTASFRFHLTMDTLAFSYVFPTTGHAKDFHLLEYAHAERTQKKSYKSSSFETYRLMTENYKAENISALGFVRSA